MSVSKTSKGNYRVRWRENNTHRSKIFDLKHDANRFEIEVRREKQRMVFPPEAPVPVAMTLLEYKEVWFRDYANANKTAGSRKNDEAILRNYLLPWWGAKNLRDITRKDVHSLQSALVEEERLSRKTINNIIGLYHNLFKDAMGWDLLDKNPCAGVKPLAVGEQDFDFWNHEDRDNFLAYAKIHDPYLHDLVAIAVYMGLRKGEMEGLLRDALDIEARQITVKRNHCYKTGTLLSHTKGKKIRRIPMNEVVYRILKLRSSIPQKESVLPCDYHHIVDRRFKPLQETAGVKVITWHDLRHSFSSHLAMNGVSMFDVKALLGHANISTTMRYAHLAPDHLNGITDLLLNGRRNYREDKNLAHKSFY
ncbi:MAG TPA: tyrosine-type recombinase/integrase [Oligoflexus sp.]|uniref:tyrosine-type recombinase/integrase n=1 Tax=Oligoflexus sp. TaxID=1971216 RepID=UPI002D7E781D|nr:tyrosine-type recombinase/integrase [Oligoflexus sp.]HET9236215.1 tyrosine-type recombinase/integrase [Oligoflexus sp.]